jgi:hypothetical protein
MSERRLGWRRRAALIKKAIYRLTRFLQINGRIRNLMPARASAMRFSSGKTEGDASPDKTLPCLITRVLTSFTMTNALADTFTLGASSSLISLERER